MAAGPKFGDLQGLILICVKSLYGLKTSMGRWHEALSNTLRLIGFQPSKADPDFQIRDARGHWEYLAVYSDDLLKPEFYPRGDVNMTKMTKGSVHSFSARMYIKNVCDKIEKMFETTLKNYGSLLEGDITLN